MILSFLMTKFGINVLLSISQSVTDHTIMLILPCVSQLSNVTCQLKDIYGLGCGDDCGIGLTRRYSYPI